MYLEANNRIIVQNRCYFGGAAKPPAPPKPPSPPTKDDAATSILGQGKKKTSTGYASTVLGTMGNPNNSQGSSSILGG